MENGRDADWRVNHLCPLSDEAARFIVEEARGRLKACLEKGTVPRMEDVRASRWGARLEDRVAKLEAVERAARDAWRTLSLAGLGGFGDPAGPFGNSPAMVALDAALAALGSGEAAPAPAVKCGTCGHRWKEHSSFAGCLAFTCDESIPHDHESSDGSCDCSCDLGPDGEVSEDAAGTPPPEPDVTDAPACASCGHLTEVHVACAVCRCGTEAPEPATLEAIRAALPEAAQLAETAIRALDQAKRVTPEDMRRTVAEPLPSPEPHTHTPDGQGLCPCGADLVPGPKVREVGPLTEHDRQDERDRLDRMLAAEGRHHREVYGNTEPPACEDCHCGCGCCPACGGGA